MERLGGEAAEGSGASNPAEPAPAAAAGGTGKAKSCKGSLYYSSALRSRARGPVCVGITRNIPKVPDNIVGEIELEAIQEGSSLSDFRYACVGYSMYQGGKENSLWKHDKRVQLPVCTGIELLADRGVKPKEAPATLRKMLRNHIDINQGMLETVS